MRSCVQSNLPRVGAMSSMQHALRDPMCSFEVPKTLRGALYSMRSFNMSLVVSTQPVLHALCRSMRPYTVHPSLRRTAFLRPPMSINLWRSVPPKRVLPEVRQS